MTGIDLTEKIDWELKFILSELMSEKKVNVKGVKKGN